MKPRAALLLVAARAFVPPGYAKPTVVDAKLHHLRPGAEREWSDFPLNPGGPSLLLTFPLADRVELYANGRIIRDEKIRDADRAGVKWCGEWMLPRFKQVPDRPRRSGRAYWAARSSAPIGERKQPGCRSTMESIADEPRSNRTGGVGDGSE